MYNFSFVCVLISGRFFVTRENFVGGYSVTVKSNESPTPLTWLQIKVTDEPYSPNQDEPYHLCVTSAAGEVLMRGNLIDLENYLCEKGMASFVCTQAYEQRKSVENSGVNS